VIFGGQSTAQSLYSSTLIDESDVDSKIMQEEILVQYYQFYPIQIKADIQIIFSKYEETTSKRRTKKRVKDTDNFLCHE
jgi:hypothetical protein